jgi:hypothetical protein
VTLRTVILRLATALIPTVEAEPCHILMTNRLGTVPVPNFQSFFRTSGRWSFLSSVATFLLVVGQACRRAVQLDPEFTLVLIEQNWMNSAFQDWRNQELKQFTKETGIRVKLLPAPEGAEPLDVCRSFLETGAKFQTSME